MITHQVTHNIPIHERIQYTWHSDTNATYQYHISSFYDHHKKFRSIWIHTSSILVASIVDSRRQCHPTSPQVSSHLIATVIASRRRNRRQSTLSSPRRATSFASVITDKLQSSVFGADVNS